MGGLYLSERATDRTFTAWSWNCAATGDVVIRVEGVARPMALNVDRERTQATYRAACERLASLAFLRAKIALGHRQF